MEERFKENNFQHLKNLLLASIFTLSLLISIAFFVLLHVEKGMKSNLKENLLSTLRSNVNFLDLWIKEKKVDAEVVAGNHELQKLLLRHIELTKNLSTLEELFASPGLQLLRNYLSGVIEKYEFVGFVVFNSEGREVASLLDSPLGESSLMGLSDFFERSIKGKTIISLPFQGEVDLPDKHGILHSNWPTMFVSTPIRNSKGQMKGVLAFRIRPETEFSELLRVSRFGESGETYTFSSKGVLLSDSRFNKQLRQLNLIPQAPGIPSILNLKIQDPQANLTMGIKPDLPRKDWPLTRMAASATIGGSEVEVIPYNDYRGVPVVGAWTWLNEHNMGIASEVDAKEALKPIYSLRNSFFALCAFLILTSALGVIIRAKQILSDKKLREKELKGLDEKLKTQIILDNVVDAIITINDLGIVQTFNQGAQRLFQYNEEEVVGENIKILMPEPDRSQHDDYLKRYLSTKRPNFIGISRELKGLKKNGVEFSMDLALSQVNLHDRIIFTGVIRDISQQKEFESALVEAKVLADEANRSKDNFLANMSHEIRTPMNGIIGLTQLALNTNLNPIQKDYLNKIESSSKNLLAIINDILDVSKIEAGKLDLENTDFYLEKILEGVSDVLSAEILEKGLELHFDIGDDVPKSLRGDPLRLSQILTNLTSNAVKFTEKGHIIITLRTLKKSAELVDIEFSVRDSGIGLSQAQIEKLFKPFNQADTSTTRKFGGTGLGLTIVKKLVLMMGGDIKIESQIGLGSNFIFNAILEPIYKEDEILLPQPSFKNLRILVIDDSPIMCCLLMTMLKELGCENPTVSYSFGDGFQELSSSSQDHAYDLVILDNKLPDAVGAEVCSEIKNLNSKKDTKIILISGFGGKEIYSSSKSPEFEGFLNKPITLSALFNMIQYVLGHQEKSDILINDPKENEIKPLSPIHGAQILVVEDHKINQQIASELLQNFGLNVSIVENGQEALDAVKQIKFDTVLMDIQMPVMDGYRATREIRALSQFKDLPIVAMTANANIGDREKALACGMNDHIPKPIDAKKLFETLVQVISAKSDFQATTTGNQPKQNSLIGEKKESPTIYSSISGLDIEEGLKLVAHNEELYTNLLIQFSKNKFSFLEQIDTAIKNGDLKMATDLLHSLKGVASGIGAKDLTEKALKIERKLKSNSIDSEYDSILKSAKESMDILIKGIKLLEQQLSSKNKSVISQPLPEYEKLAPLIKVLKDLILDHDLKSLSYLGTIEETFLETPIKDLLGPVKDNLNKYDFFHAVEVLKNIECQLQFASTHKN